MAEEWKIRGYALGTLFGKGSKTWHSRSPNALRSRDRPVSRCALLLDSGGNEVYIAYKSSNEVIRRPQIKKTMTMIRPEAVVVHSTPAGAIKNTFPGIVRRAIFVGSKFQCEIDLGESIIRGELPPWSGVKAGPRVTVELPASRMQVLRQ